MTNLLFKELHLVLNFLDKQLSSTMKSVCAYQYALGEGITPSGYPYRPFVPVFIACTIHIYSFIHTPFIHYYQRNSLLSTSSSSYVKACDAILSEMLSFCHRVLGNEEGGI